MIKATLICTCAALLLLTIALIAHTVAMTYPRWKIYENRQHKHDTILIGIFHRCEYYRRNGSKLLETKTNLICEDNKYIFHGQNTCSRNLSSDQAQKLCNMDQKVCDCYYSSIAKGLIACNIISAVTVGLSLILIFSHILINEFKYKIHIYIVIITLCLLFLGFLFMLATLILLGSTMPYDLYQYVYDLDNKVLLQSNASAHDNIRSNITQMAATTYEIRLDWSGVLEIVALVLLCFTIATQFIYLLFTYRSRIG